MEHRQCSHPALSRSLCADHAGTARAHRQKQGCRGGATAAEIAGTSGEPLLHAIRFLLVKSVHSTAWHTAQHGGSSTAWHTAHMARHTQHSTAQHGTHSTAHCTARHTAQHGTQHSTHNTGWHSMAQNTAQHTAQHGTQHSMAHSIAWHTQHSTA